MNSVCAKCVCDTHYKSAKSSAHLKCYFVFQLLANLDGTLCSAMTFRHSYSFLSSLVYRAHVFSTTALPGFFSTSESSFERQR